MDDNQNEIPMKPISIRFPDYLVELAEEARKKDGSGAKNFSEWVREMIERTVAKVLTTTVPSTQTFMAGKSSRVFIQNETAHQIHVAYTDDGDGLRIIVTEKKGA